ncbi:MAG: ABC transporter substrate-binding protein [Cyanobacteria bacterium J06650_10]
MKRRWFLAGLALPAVIASCQTVGTRGATDDDADGLEDAEGAAVRVVRNDKTLVMATAANYPPYEQVLAPSGSANAAASRSDTSGRSTGNEAGVEESSSSRRASASQASTSRSVSSESASSESEPQIVGFDIDLARLIAARLERELTIVNLEFGALIPALVNDEVDIAMAALNPSRSRKQRVDFSNIYYRARHALVSLDGYLRSRDLNYQTIGVQANSVQARFADTTDELANLDIVPYPTLEEIFEALDIGAISGAFLEANVAEQYVRRYPAFEAQLMPTEEPTGSAIAMPKSSPLRRDINRAISDIKASGEMDRLIVQWFS